MSLNEILGMPGWGIEIESNGFDNWVLVQLYIMGKATC